jgi:hypothetical protein
MKSCICALTRGYENVNNYDTLIERNNSIYNLIYKNNRLEYDIILFHEGNINEEHQKYIKSRTPDLEINFINIQKEFDINLNRTTGKYSKLTENNNSFTFGYKCMCRFWSYIFIKYTTEYKYVIRIDEDCIIHNFPDNICNELKNNKIYFLTGLMLTGFSDGEHAYGMPEFTKEFLENNNINPSIDFMSVPYTNFCIIDIQYFNNCELFNNWAKSIEDEGGIFVSRWGDANLWGIFLYLSNIINNNFLEDKRIKYYHGTHYTIIN